MVRNQQASTVSGFSSLSTRVALIISAALLVLMLGASLWIDSRLTSAIEKQEHEQVELQTRTLLTSLETLMLNGSGTLAREWLDNLEGAHGILKAAVYDQDGTEAFYLTRTMNRVNMHLGSNHFRRSSMPPPESDRFFDEKFLREVFLRGVDAEIVRQDYLTHFMPVPNRDACKGCHGYDDTPLRGVFAVTVSRDGLQQRVSDMRRQLWFLAGLLSLLLGAGLWLVMRKSILMPLSHLRDAIEKVAGGDRRAMLPVLRNDEFGEVAKLFNVMQEQIEEGEARIRAVMDNVMDGVMILNTEGWVESVNPAMSKMFGYSAAEISESHASRFLVAENHHNEGPRFLSKEYFGHADIVQAIVREDMAMRKDESVFPVEVALNEMHVGARLYYVVTLRDITLRIEQMKVLKHLALHDSLTGLPNRTLLTDRIQQVISASAREYRTFALMFMDLDRFKEINDEMGHHIGDELLCFVAAKIRENVRKMDTVARLGGDEFAVLLPGINEETAVKVADKILDALRSPLSLEGREIKAEISIGIALYPHHGKDQVTIMQQADVAMYKAKRARSGFAVYGVPQQ